MLYILPQTLPEKKSFWKILRMDQQLIWKGAWAKMVEIYPPQHITMWFAGLQLTAVEESCVFLSCDNAFKKDYIEKRYLQSLRDLFSQLLQRQVDVRLSIVPSTTKSKKRLADQDSDLGPLFPHGDFSMPQPSPSGHAGLNQSYTFANFIVGNSNNIAYAAAQAVGKNPGYTYNPFFIFGGVGVGKTHLMHAVGNAIVTAMPEKKVVYITTEKFTNDFIEALSSKRIKEFRERYRKVDVLLIDDIQFLSGREGTQEEFFHTFNELHMSGRQIMLSSDRKPQDIAKLEDRLSSRFLGGLAVDVGEPDFEMRVAILKDKAVKRRITLPDEACHAIASLIISNTRELEGALTKVTLSASASGVEITAALVQKVLGVQTPTVPPSVSSPKEILSHVAHYFTIKQVDLIGPKRDRHLVVPRQIAMYLMRIELNIPLVKVGQLLGNRDHTTIMHGVAKIEKELSTNDQLKRDILLIQQQLVRVN